MEEFSLPADTLLPVLTDVPESLQFSTKRVCTDFLLVLTLANSVLFMCYVGILKRRKIFIIVVNLLIAATMIVFGMVPSWTLLLVTTGVLGIGFGIYASVDAALVTEVSPSAHNQANDIGIINIANIIPQSLAPALAALIISMSHSYLALYATSAVIAVLGILSVFPIRSVR